MTPGAIGAGAGDDLEVLLLRLDAPLMSFGGVVVDHHNPTDAFPYRGLLTGLLANALGYVRSDEAAHERLQARLRYAARRDRAGETLVDYQTVDFGVGAMEGGLGWTSRGVLEGRKGGEAAEGTHIRYRHYLADAVYTVALTLAPADEEPTLDAVEEALRSPARPLFLGRKCCVPSAPLLLGRARAPSLRASLEAEPRAERATPTGTMLALWPASESPPDARGVTREVVRVEDRDFASAGHAGRRFYVEGLVDPPARPARRSA